MDKWLRSNAFVKIMSVILAVLLYIVVNDSALGIAKDNKTASTIIRDVSLEPQLNNDNLVVADIPQTVNLTLRGSNFILNRVVAGNYRAYVDLKDLDAGVHRNVPVKVEGLPQGADYVTDPSTVRVVLEEKQQKEMSVDVEVVGKPAEGYSVGTPVVTPQKVLVRASESRLKNVAFVKATVKLSEDTKSVKQSVQLKAVNEAGTAMEDVEISEPVADVEVPITSPTKEIPLRPEIDKLPPDGYSVEKVTMSEEKVTVFGKKDIIDGLEVYRGPALDLSDVTKDRTFELPIPLIKGVDKVDPKTVRIEVEIVRSKKRTFKDLSFGVNGMPEGWKVRFVDDDTVSVVVAGSATRMGSLTKREIQPVINVSNFRPGKHKVNIHWNLPAYIKVIDPPETVEIELKDKR
ncbi:CdaR family protein [Numidum massiliense]|uniref:CdaR family protein n=1 Tax=Numidum massiliense TaxID=1522315 RepID=UPI0006D59845|nr:CdaR family protein [Numidum massiliense]